MKKIQLEIIAITHSVSPSHNYAVILGEKDGKRRIPIVIGGFEAQGIAIAVEKMTPNRPLTHDLFKATMDNYGIVIHEVVINELLDGIFYAHLICEQNGDVSVIDSRTSDAIAMAVRFQCPIYTFENIVDLAGVEMEIDSEQGTVSARPSRQGDSRNQTLEDLEGMLQSAIEDEDYEKAARLRDEINKRRGN